jgi:protocatechuate 3,4-dioxygenase beta subunit
MRRRSIRPGGSAPPAVAEVPAGRRRHGGGRPAGAPLARVVFVAIAALTSLSAAIQSVHEAPPAAPSTGRVAPDGEPGQSLHVSGLVVDRSGKPVPGVSLYVYQTDHEGYYGVKPASDNRNPRLKLFLRSDARGAWAFETVKPGSYPDSRVPPHIHFEVSAPGHAPKIFEIVFEGDAFVTAQMRSNPAFSVRPIDAGKVTERIVLD